MMISPDGVTYRAYEIGEPVVRRVIRLATTAAPTTSREAARPATRNGGADPFRSAFPADARDASGSSSTPRRAHADRASGCKDSRPVPGRRHRGRRAWDRALDRSRQPSVLPWCPVPKAVPARSRSRSDRLPGRLPRGPTMKRLRRRSGGVLGHARAHPLSSATTHSYVRWREASAMSPSARRWTRSPQHSRCSSRERTREARASRPGVLLRRRRARRFPRGNS